MSTLHHAGIHWVPYVPAACDALSAVRFRALADAPPDSWVHLNPGKYWTTNSQGCITDTFRMLTQLAKALGPASPPPWHTRRRLNGTVWVPKLEAAPFREDAARFGILARSHRSWGHVSLQHYFRYDEDGNRITHNTLAGLADSLREYTR